MELVAEIIDTINSKTSSCQESVDKAINQALTLILNDMMTKGDDINASMICSVDGIPWASKTEDSFDQDRFAAMSGALLALSDNLAVEGDKGETNNVLIEGKNGNIFILHASNNLLLTVFTRGNSSLGISLAYARHAIETISAIMENS